MVTEIWAKRVDSLLALTQTGGGGTATSQASWYIDPQNSTGLASDSNTGTSSAAPLLTYAEIVRRWGTYAPRIMAGVTITFLSSHVDDSDPVIWRPLCHLDNTLTDQLATIQGTLGAAQQVATGTLGTVTSATNTALQTAIMPAGSYAPGMLIKNTARGSVAWLKELVAGTTWLITQPITGVAPTYGARLAIPTEDVGWAPGDSVTVYRPVAVNLVEFQPTPTAILPSTDDYAWLYQLTVFNPDTTNQIQGVFLGPVIDVAQCSFTRTVSLFEERNLGDTFIFNSWLQEGISSRGITESATFSGPAFYAGAIGANSKLYTLGLLYAAAFDMGVCISGHLLPVSLHWGFVGDVFLDTGTVLEVNELVQIGATLPPIFSGLARVRGPGAINVFGTGKLAYVGGITALATFLNSGGLQLNGAGTASSTAGNPAVIHTGIALTPTNLDAPAGPAGFGGLAFNLGGATIASFA